MDGKWVLASRRKVKAGDSVRGTVSFGIGPHIYHSTAYNVHRVIKQHGLNLICIKNCSERNDCGTCMAGWGDDGLEVFINDEPPITEDEAKMAAPIPSADDVRKFFFGENI